MPDVCTLGLQVMASYLDMKPKEVEQRLFNPPVPYSQKKRAIVYLNSNCAQLRPPALTCPLCQHTLSTCAAAAAAAALP